jgi:carbamoylphosphate synthase small subunit
MLFCCPTDDVDTRAITRRLRQDGSLIGVLSTEESKADEELLDLSRSWDIVGKNFMQLFKGFANTAENFESIVFLPKILSPWFSWYKLFRC